MRHSIGALPLFLRILKIFIFEKKESRLRQRSYFAVYNHNKGLVLAQCACSSPVSCLDMKEA